MKPGAAKVALAAEPSTRCAERSSPSIHTSYCQIGLYTCANGSTMYPLSHAIGPSASARTHAAT